MEPSWHQNRSKWRAILENLKISQIVLSLQRGLDFQGFEARSLEVKIHGFPKVFPQRVRKTPQEAPKTPQDAPKTSGDAPKRRPRRPKTAQEHRKTPQDAPKTRPRASQERKKLGQIWDRKAIYSGPPSKARFLSVLGWILGGFWGGLGELLRSIFHGFYV